MAGEARLKILRVAPASGRGVPGAIVGAPLVVACGEGAVAVEELQRAGRGAKGVAEFLRGFALPVGSVLV
jgi:methionyl-tRNA formyltransferase